MFSLKNINDNLFGEVIINPSQKELRNLASHMEVNTEFKSASYISEVRNRSAKNTYIVDEIETGVDQQNISKRKADEIASKVFEYIKDKEMIRVDRKMGMNKKFSFNCRLYISKQYARIAYMWNNTLFNPDNAENPDLVSIYIPEWPQRIMFAYPESGLSCNISLSFNPSSISDPIIKGFVPTHLLDCPALVGSPAEVSIDSPNINASNA